MKVAILTGAGISAESGIKTFRDSDGLWEGHDVMSVASPQGFRKDPALVLDFYNQRRRQLLEVYPNKAHISISELENMHDVVVITQNVDDLHERAGNSRVIHLHGELLKVRSEYHPENVLEWRTDLHIGDTCSQGHQLRPHIVWFGEAVPKMEEAIRHVQESDAVIIVGTSMQVYPAAGLIEYAAEDCKIYFIDPNPSMSSNRKCQVFAEKATVGVPKVIEILYNTT